MSRPLMRRMRSPGSSPAAAAGMPSPTTADHRLARRAAAGAGRSHRTARSSPTLARQPAEGQRARGRRRPSAVVTPTARIEPADGVLAELLHGSLQESTACAIDRGDAVAGQHAGFGGHAARRVDDRQVVRLADHEHQPERGNT